MNIGVVIPALNEERAIPLVVREIPRAGEGWRVTAVIVVDNGSSDRPAEAARAAGAQVVREPRRGYGQACLTGIATLPAGVDVVVFLDGDHSDYPEDLPALLRPLLHDEAQLVIGSRVLGGAPPDSLTLPQRLGNQFVCALLRRRFGGRWTDLGPFRAIRRDVLDSLMMRDGKFGWNIEMQAKVLRAGLTVTEVPVRYRPRIGVSKISGTLSGSIRAGTGILDAFIRYALP